MSLLGIRVSWTIKSEYLHCTYSSLRVELNHLHRSITINDSSGEFYDLTCNRYYTPKVKAFVRGVQRGVESGAKLFYGGTSFITVYSKTVINIYFIASMSSAPARILQVCAGPQVPMTIQGRVNISWALLPCHLQNRASVTGYIIRYNRTSRGEFRNITNSDGRIQCRIEADAYYGRYSCLLPHSLLSIHTYTFQVAAISRFGVAPFSGLVLGRIGGQSIIDKIIFIL